MRYNWIGLYIVCVFLLFFGSPLFAQSGASVGTQENRQSSNTGTQTSNANVFTGTSASTGTPQNTQSMDHSGNIMLARSSAEYLVTPGDVYTLAYAAASTPVSYTIAVDASYRIRVSNLGIINGAGKTFMQLKREVETTVANNYPLSGVQLVLTQPAVFRVAIIGEVYTSGEISAWGLSRLSSLVGNYLTDYASIRDISIKSAGGQVKVYDLFQAQRFGDFGQDPYLRPGDVITFNRIKRAVTIDGAVERPGVYQLIEGENLKQLISYYGNGLTAVADKTRAILTRFVDSAEISGDAIHLTERELSEDYILYDMDKITVPAISELRPAVPVNRLDRTITVSGAVRRPGTYELLPNENLKELIEVYAGGFNPLADRSRLEVMRLLNSDDISGSKLFLTEEDFSNNFHLEHYDSITVPDVTKLQPVMFIEGAISLDITAELTTSNRVTIQFPTGETYASLVRRNAGLFSAVSDTQNAYILRGEAQIPINLNPMLYDASYQGTASIKDEDVLIIPFRQYFVTVSGSVQNPGRYPYIPDRDWEYYIGLAGGFISEKNLSKQVAITNVAGKRMKKTDAITPETVITATTNHFLYYINQYAPIVTMILGVITSIFTIQAALN